MTLLFTPSDRFWANASLSLEDKLALKIKEPEPENKHLVLAYLINQASLFSEEERNVFKPSLLICRWLNEGLSPFTPFPVFPKDLKGWPSYFSQKSIWECAIELKLYDVIEWCFKNAPHESKAHMKIPLNGRNKLPIYWASENGDIPLIQLFEKQGCDFNETAQDGKTALMGALKIETVEALIKGGASFKKVDQKNKDAIWYWQHSLIPDFRIEKMKQYIEDLRIKTAQSPVDYLPSLLKEIKAKNETSIIQYVEALGFNSWKIENETIFKKPINLLTAVALRVGQNKKAGRLFKIFLNKQDKSIYDWDTESAPSSIGLLMMMAQMEVNEAYRGYSYGTNSKNSFRDEFKSTVLKSWDEYAERFGPEKAFVLPLKTIQKFKKTQLGLNELKLLNFLLELGFERYIDKNQKVSIPDLLNELSQLSHLNLALSQIENFYLIFSSYLEDLVLVDHPFTPLPSKVALKRKKTDSLPPVNASHSAKKLEREGSEIHQESWKNLWKTIAGLSISSKDASMSIPKTSLDLMVIWRNTVASILTQSPVSLLGLIFDEWIVQEKFDFLRETKGEYREVLIKAEQKRLSEINPASHESYLKSNSKMRL